MVTVAAILLLTSRRRNRKEEAMMQTYCQLLKRIEVCKNSQNSASIGFFLLKEESSILRCEIEYFPVKMLGDGKADVKRVENLAVIKLHISAEIAEPQQQKN